MKRKKTGAVVCGAYGMENAGDDAVLTAILRQLRKIEKDIPVTVIARHPGSTAARFGVRCIHPFAVFLWLSAMRQTKLFISGGGSLLQNVTSRRSLWFYLLTIRMAKCAGCAVQLYGCGMGPISGRRAQKKTAIILNRCADAVTLRDGDSLAFLKDIGVTKPVCLISADPALGLTPNTREREQTMGIILRAWDGFWVHVPEFAAAARYGWEKYRLRPVFLCLSPKDSIAARSVCAELEDIPFTVRPYTGSEARMTAVLSMRLHGLVFSLRDGTPAAGISYDPKVDAFCREAGLPVFPLNEVTESVLCAAVDELMIFDGEKLSAASTMLREREKVNGRTAAALLAEE